MDLSWGLFCPSGVIWQCLKTSLVSTTEDVLLASSGERPGDAAEHPTMHRIAPNKELFS